MHVELSSGARRRLSLLPGAGLGLAVTEDKLFIPNPEGHELWVVDRRAGQFRRPIDVGRHPIGLALRAVKGSPPALALAITREILEKIEPPGGKGGAPEQVGPILVACQGNMLRAKRRAL